MKVTETNFSMNDFILIHLIFSLSYNVNNVNNKYMNARNKQMKVNYNPASSCMNLAAWS